MLRVYGVYAKARLRHFVELSGRAFLRHWQGILLLGFVVQGSVITVLTAPAAGLAGLVRGGNPTGLLALAAFGALWVLPQRKAIVGEPLATYAATLPLSQVAVVLVDLTVLLLADALFVLELALAVVAGGVGLLPALIGVLALILAVQLAVLHLPLPRSARLLRRLPLPPPLRVNLQALAEHPVASGTRFAVALALAALAAVAATGLHFDARALPVAIAALALAGFVLADFYRLLRDAHAPIASFIATLPLPSHHLLLRDLLTVLLVGAGPFIMLAVWFGVFDPGSLVAFAALAVAYALLLALLRLPLLRGGRLGAMLAALIAAGWAGSAIAMVLK